MASDSPNAFPQLQSSSPSSLSSRRSSGARTPLSLDLSSIPPLITPSPPSNTLLITNLDDVNIFLPQNLQTIRNLIDQHASIYSWGPLKSFRRIIVVFHTVEASKLIKSTLDGEVIFDCRVRVYFGAHTDTTEKDQHLEAPKSDKLFFISPPPSPPHGWEMRNEDPPNKDVHAEDLAHALSKLHARQDPPSPDMEVDETQQQQRRHGQWSRPDPTRNRSGSIIVYHPDHHGDSPNLPAIAVEDLTISPTEDASPMEMDLKKPFAHTMRPPVELMQ